MLATPMEVRLMNLMKNKKTDGEEQTIEETTASAENPEDKAISRTNDDNTITPVVAFKPQGQSRSKFMYTWMHQIVYIEYDSF